MVLLTTISAVSTVYYIYLYSLCVAGPKGVINDWRRFKLDSVDQTVPQNKRQLLRQMSSPRDDDKERPNRKVGRSHGAEATTYRLRDS